MRVTEHTTETAFTLLRPYWNDLLSRSETDQIFLTWEWQHTWWQVYHGGELWIIVCQDSNDRIVGIAPWFIQDAQAERVVRTIGCVDVSDYVDLIVAKEHAAEVQAALATYLWENQERFDRVSLCNIPQISSTIQHFPAALRKKGFVVSTLLQEVCPVIHLPPTWEAYLESLGKKQRHELRRKLRRAESEVELVYRPNSPKDDFASDVELFLRLMASSQPSKADFLRDAANERFFRSILDQAFANDWLRLSFLYMNGVPVAAYCDFDFNDRILVYNSGLSLEHFAHLSPGIVLLAYNIQDAISTDHKIFDFLRGNETYKYRMGAIDTCLFELVVNKSVTAEISVSQRNA